MGLINSLDFVLPHSESDKEIGRRFSINASLLDSLLPRSGSDRGIGKRFGFEVTIVRFCFAHIFFYEFLIDV